MFKVRILILLAIICYAKSSAEKFIAFSEFTQSAKFDANWNLKRDIPRYLAGKVSYPFVSVPFDSVPLINKKRSDLLHVTADIVKFSVKKRVAGDGQLAGFKNYTADCEIMVSIYGGVTGALLKTEQITATFKDNNTAVNIVRLSKDELNYDSLEIVDFGSPTFERSVVGAMMRDLSAKVNAVLLTVSETKKVASDKTLIRVAKVVDIQGDNIFVNSGFEDNIAPGDIYRVFTNGDSIFDPDTREFLGVSERYVGEIRVAEVKASRFMRSEIVNGSDKIKLHDLVRIER